MTKLRNTPVRKLAVAAFSCVGLVALAACEREPQEPVAVATPAIEVSAATAPATPAEGPAVAEQAAPAEAKTATPATAPKAALAKAPAKAAAPAPQPEPKAEDHSGHDMSAMPSGESHSGH